MFESAVVKVVKVVKAVEVAGVRVTEQQQEQEALVYVDQDMPGIMRHRKGEGFSYRAADGHWLRARDPRDNAHLMRIRKLAIPPAYVDVWICPLPNGHLQAWGRDARGRKQYRYHAQWREARDQDKFDRMREFGRALPGLRKQVAHDLAGAGQGDAAPGRLHVLATLLRLLDATHIRVGNESYTRENKSYGLTTLRNRHAKVEGHRVMLRFRGKSGVWQEVALQDPRVARVVRKCQNLPGQDLFQYEEDQTLHGIGSADVNAYIREASGGDFTAKDFRTWHASVHAWALLAPRALSSTAKAADEDNAPLTLVQALQQVAARLGNTVAVCRKSYVHPMVLACAASAEWPSQGKQRAARYAIEGLDDRERGLLRFLDAAVAASSKA
jgi:DNA topoisomerase-1